MRFKIFIILGLFMIFMLSIFCSAQQLAFPGAEGSGKFTTGGRGGKAIYVTNLNDSGKGSFRAAIDNKGTRTIVFAVSGTVFLKSEIEIEHGDLTIAGQTAPGDGICIAGYPVKIDTDNVIIRFMRFRLGDINKFTGDAFGAQRQKNIIIDHCSFSWATDENASFYDNENFTLQWCIISESLNNSVHYKGEHGYGGIWGGHVVSFHHNLVVHNTSRNPRFNGSRTGTIDIVDFRNNVLYNWGDNSIYGGEEGFYNMVGNYYKAGPATADDCRNRIVNITTGQSFGYGRFYVSDNHTEESTVISADNWNGGVKTRAVIDSVRANSPFKHIAVRQQPAVEAFESVLLHAGASLARDSVDSRIIREVRTGTACSGSHFRGGGNGIIDSQDDVGGWPELNPAAPPVDTDYDGMPDDWELRNSIDSDDSADGAIYGLDTDYTNLEVYINGLVETICK